ncbi:LytR/AlgR family response regulator transcription factor [Emticicia sp. 17c]|uniref:LytR/AlgR family response regulator transcription factor n=1 Tax=Emticicia sp. 17c TaxID=3127704 RepID=UPI00301C4B25
MKAIIIDDEQKSRNLLKELLNRYCPDVEVLDSAANAQQGIELIRKNTPDVVFLDIYMPDIDGFQLLDLLGDINFDIIFVTAYNEFAVKAYKYTAFDYLLKPVIPDDLQKTIERLKLKHEKSKLNEQLSLLLKIWKTPKELPNKLIINSLDGITLLNISEIICLEADGPYTTIFTANDGKIVSSKNLREYEDVLTEHHFFRTHHSFMVNLNHVKKFIKADNLLVLTNGQTVDVSKRKKEEFLEMLKNI